MSGKENTNNADGHIKKKKKIEKSREGRNKIVTGKELAKDETLLMR